MAVKKKPQYRAFKVEESADDVFSYKKPIFDPSVEWTKDDYKKFDELVMSPTDSDDYIKAVQERISEFKITTQAEQIHIDAINSKISDLNTFGRHFSWREERLIVEIIGLHYRILTMLNSMLPTVRSGMSDKKAKKKGGKNRHSKDEYLNESKIIIKDLHPQNRQKYKSRAKFVADTMKKIDEVLFEYVDTNGEPRVSAYSTIDSWAKNLDEGKEI